MSLSANGAAAVEWIMTAYVPSLLIVGLLSFFSRKTNDIKFIVIEHIIKSLTAAMLSLKLLSYYDDFFKNEMLKVPIFAAVTSFVIGITVSWWSFTLTEKLTVILSTTNEK